MDGLLLIHTGDGKGKTTAALGLMLRALGHQQKVLIVQFIKGSDEPGEVVAIKRFLPDVEISRVGLGFLPADKSAWGPHRDACHKGLELARFAFENESYDLVILDELNYAVAYGLVTVEEMLSLLESRPAKTNVVITGRSAHPRLIEIADLVTEMKCIKHPFEKGIPAQEGVEF